MELRVIDRHGNRARVAAAARLEAASAAGVKSRGLFTRFSSRRQRKDDRGPSSSSLLLKFNGVQTFFFFFNLSG